MFENIYHMATSGGWIPFLHSLPKTTGQIHRRTRSRFRGRPECERRPCCFSKRSVDATHSSGWVWPWASWMKIFHANSGDEYDVTDDNVTWHKSACFQDVNDNISCSTKLFSFFQEPLYLDKCIVCAESDWEDYFEVQELASKDTFIFKVSVFFCV